MEKKPPGRIAACGLRLDARELPRLGEGMVTLPHAESDPDPRPAAARTHGPLPWSRRTFLHAAVAGAAASLTARWNLQGQGAAGGQRRLRLCLTPGSIGVSANQREAIALAAKHGFEAVEPYGGQLASLDGGALAEVVESLQARGLAWGAAGLPVEFRRGTDSFEEGLRQLPKVAAGLHRAGVTRVGTWLSPASGGLTYLQNFRQHAVRLKAVAGVLKDHGLRLGLEYVGTISSRTRARYTFIHTLAETGELIAEIGKGNVGVVLDSWHWWQAGDTVEDLLRLKDEEVVSVDLNDAPAGLPKEQQADGRRELPAATGVIDLGAFLRALEQIGYSGPVRAEPFNRVLNDLDNEAACAATIAALRRALELGA